MNYYELPKSVMIAGNSYEIRSDYRAVLDICTAFSDTELSDEERFLTALMIFYPDFDDIPKDQMKEACTEMVKFIDMGEPKKAEKKGPKLIDWEQDFKYMISPINKVAGYEIRDVEYLHWWTFLGLYNEIDGDSFFGQIVGIRSKLAKHKKLDKHDNEFYKNNREAIDFKNHYTDSETDLMEEWIYGGRQQRDSDPGGDIAEL